jgi:methyl-accepting chemotaxis protein
MTGAQERGPRKIGTGLLLMSAGVGAVMLAWGEVVERIMARLAGLHDLALQAKRMVV